MEHEKKKRQKKKKNKQSKANESAPSGVGEHPNLNSEKADVQNKGMLQTVTDSDRESMSGTEISRPVEAEKSSLNKIEASLGQKIRDLQEQLDVHMQREADLEKDILQSQKERSLWHHKETELETRLLQLQTDKESWLQKEASYEDSINRLVEETASLRSTVVSLKETLVKMEEEKVKLAQREKLAVETIAPLNKQYTVLQAQVIELEASRNDISLQNQQLKEYVFELQSKIQDLKSSVATCSSTERTKVNLLNAELDQKSATTRSSILVKPDDPMIRNSIAADINENSASETDPMQSLAEKSDTISDLGPSSEARDGMVSDKHVEPLNDEVTVLKNNNVDHMNAEGSDLNTISRASIEEIVQISLDENDVAAPTTSRSFPVPEKTDPVALTDAPLIGAPFRLISFVARYVSGADLVQNKGHMLERLVKTARSSFNAVQQHLVGTQNITRKNVVGSEIPLSKKLADDVCEPSAGGVSDRERVVTEGILPAEVCNTSVTRVMQRRYVTSCLGNRRADELDSQPFLAPGVPRLKNSCDGAAASPVRSDILHGVRNRVVTDASYTTTYQSPLSNNGGQQTVNLADLSLERGPAVGRSASVYDDLWRQIRKRVVTNSFHTTDYESTPSSLSSQLPVNLANCLDAFASGSEATYNFNALSNAAATSACINSRGSDIGAPDSASMRVRGLSRSSIRVSTPGVSRQRSPAMSCESCAFDRNVRRRLSYDYSTIPAANIDAHFGHRNTDVAESSSTIVGGHSGSSIDVSTLDRQHCSGLNGQRGLSRQRSSAPNFEDRTAHVPESSSACAAAHSRSYTNMSTNVRRLSSTQSNLTPTTLPTNLGNRNTNVPESSSTRAEGSRSSYVVIPQRILILATVAIDVINVGLYFGMVNDLKNEVGNRMHHFGSADEGLLNPEIVERLIHILDDHNELVCLFRSARDKCRDNHVEEFKIRLYNTGGLRGYELPTSQCKAFRQYVVAVYCALEQSRMDYIRTHQSDIRSEYLSGLYDVVSRGDRDEVVVGSKIVLPTSFTGGPRYIYSHYLDALAICRTLGNPQLFITFTCNVNWPEIKRYMAQYPDLIPADRADVVCRVFEQKVKDYVK
ncbi:DNA helicase [Tanacetum coccineum]|uniref:DNA helicase n=1 Tax=Tanacetum coccineum TaxID=301880 RepID=A0ABQ5DPS9_9ASTR